MVSQRQPPAPAPTPTPTPIPTSTPSARDGISTVPNLRDRIPKLEPRRRRHEAAVNVTPVPETPSLPPPPATSPSSWAFATPERRILSKKDHDVFLASPTSDLIKAWVFGLAESVVDTPCSAVRESDASATVAAILRMLEEAGALVARSPPDEQGSSRFGNKAFRGFLDLVSGRAAAWHEALGLGDADAVAEAAAYLGESFGNRTRIDYGSGHELNFVMWLLCLYQVGLLRPSDFRALVLLVFARYLALMRTIQMTYYLEPAGSHGVWGLDDYQFLPFLFGASQLLHHPFITPRSIHQQLAIEESGADYLYLGQVGFVNDTKTVKGLRWHSPMLDDISSARSWAKIDAGMRRMFVAEVLGKLPVMQHFLFGSLVPSVEGMGRDDGSACGGGGGGDDDAESHDCRTAEVSSARHAHDGTGWGDCCGIKVPSSIAAAQEMKKRTKGDSLRRIPFD